MANYLPIEKRKQIFHLLCEGNGKRAIMRLTGCSDGAFCQLQKRYFDIISFLNRKYIKNLNISEIEADEIRTFVMRKSNIRWVYVALDRKSRMVLHFHVGKRDTRDAIVFLSGLNEKLSQKCKVSTDCLTSYVAAVSKTPDGFIPDDVSMIEMQRAKFLGNKLGRAITNRIEAHNGVIRQHVSRLTRRTRCFSKKEIGLIQHLTLFFFYYNFIKTQKSLKTSPAAFLGLTTHSLQFDELVEYDQMFTDTLTTISYSKTYGRIEKPKKVIRLNQKDREDFMRELNRIEGIEFKTTG